MSGRWALVVTGGLVVTGLLVFASRGTIEEPDDRSERSVPVPPPDVPADWTCQHGDGGVESIVPSGEWWATSGSMTAVLRIRDGVGRVGIATDGSVHGYSLVVGLSDTRWYGVEFHLIGDQGKMIWHVRPPHDMTVEKHELIPKNLPSGPVDEFVIDKVAGKRSIGVPFSIFRSALEDPLVKVKERAHVIRRLRDLVAERPERPSNG